MSRLDDLVEAALEGGLPDSDEAAAVGEPRPVALWRDGDRGVVLSLVRRGDDSLHMLVAAASRVPGGGWEVDETAGLPWIDERPATIQPVGAMRLHGLEITPGAAPPGTDEVQARLGERAASAAVHPATGAFVVAFEADEDAGPIELSA